MDRGLFSNLVCWGIWSGLALLGAQLTTKLYTQHVHRKISEEADSSRSYNAQMELMSCESSEESRLSTDENLNQYNRHSIKRS